MAKKQEVISTSGRFYYKSKNGKGFLNLKSPLDEEDAKDYIQITKEEFDELTYIKPYEPTEAELAAQEKRNQIAQLKRALAESDYVVIKIAEADTAEEQAALREEYAGVIASRKEARVQINTLEAEIGGE